MRRVEVIEEEERPKDPGILDDGDALANVGRGAVLGKGADEEKRRAGIDERRDVEPNRHVAYGDQPVDYAGDAGDMHGPDTRPLPVARSNCPQLIGEEAAHSPGGAEDESAEQRRLRPKQRPSRRIEALPLRRGEVERFRIVER